MVRWPYLTDFNSGHQIARPLLFCMRFCQSTVQLGEGTGVKACTTNAFPLANCQLLLGHTLKLSLSLSPALSLWFTKLFRHFSPRDNPFYLQTGLHFLRSRVGRIGKHPEQTVSVHVGTQSYSSVQRAGLVTSFCNQSWLVWWITCRFLCHVTACSCSGCVLLFWDVAYVSMCAAGSVCFLCYTSLWDVAATLLRLSSRFYTLSALCCYLFFSKSSHSLSKYCIRKEFEQTVAKSNDEWALVCRRLKSTVEVIQPAMPNALTTFFQVSSSVCKQACHSNTSFVK